MEIQAVKRCGLGQDSRKWLWFSDVDSENTNQYNWWMEAAANRWKSIVANKANRIESARLSASRVLIKRMANDEADSEAWTLSSCRAEASARICSIKPWGWRRVTKFQQRNSSFISFPIRQMPAKDADLLFFLICFSVWGTFFCYLLQFGTQTCNLQHFGAKIFHVHFSSMFLWFSLICP